MSIALSDFNSICRLCLKQNGDIWESLFAKEQGASLCLADKITSLASVKIEENDGYPEKICNKCSSAVRFAYSFKLQIEESHCKLEMALGAVKKEIGEIIIDHAIGCAEDTLTDEEDPIKAKNSVVPVQKVNIPMPIESDDETRFQFSSRWKKIECDVCFKSYEYINTLIRHRNSVHPENKPYSCTVCHLQFIEFFVYANHLRLVHRNEIQLTSACLVCEICGKEFLSQSNLRDHLKTHQAPEFPCRYCGNLFKTKRNVTLHERQHTGEKPYVCETCGKSFIGLNYLISHQEIHSATKHFACNTCGKAFAKKWNLVQHSRIHTGEKPYRCPLCSESFMQNFLLKAHILKIHQKDWSEVLKKPTDKSEDQRQQQNIPSVSVIQIAPGGPSLHACIHCEFTSKSKITMVRHERTHTGEEPLQEHQRCHVKIATNFKCPICPVLFTKNAILKDHISEAHQRNWEDVLKKPEKKLNPLLAYEICGKELTSEENLMSHREAHQEHCCRFCNKSFLLNYKLKKHEMTHGKPYACETCGKGFATKASMSIHQERHSTSNNFTCEVCGKSYGGKAVLREHFQSSHVKIRRTFLDK